MLCEEFYLAQSELLSLIQEYKNFNIHYIIYCYCDNSNTTTTNNNNNKNN